MSRLFAYDTAIAERFPTIRGGVIHASGLSNGRSPTELLEAFLAEQRVARGKLEERGQSRRSPRSRRGDVPSPRSG